MDRREFVKTTGGAVALSIMPLGLGFQIENSKDFGFEYAIQAWKNRTVYRENVVVIKVLEQLNDIKQLLAKKKVFISCKATFTFNNQYTISNILVLYPLSKSSFIRSYRNFLGFKIDGMTWALDKEHQILLQSGEWRKVSEFVPVDYPATCSFETIDTVRSTRSLCEPATRRIMVYRNPNSDSVGAGKIGFLC